MLRAALLRRLRASTDIPLVALIAPAGYGKTTALAQWRESDPRRFGWLSLDEGTDDPAVLLSCLAAALKDAVPMDATVMRDLEVPHPPARRRALAGLAVSVASSPHPFVLAVDDCQHLTDPENVRAVETLVANLPPGCQVALCGRTEPATSLVRMRAEGRVLDVGVAELRMDEREADAIVAAAGVDLTAREVADLTAHTEGWPVGIYLAALARRTGDARGTVAVPFGGDDRLVADYVRAQFLTGLPEEQYAFLIRTAYLDEMSGPLCDAVLDRTGSGSLLEELESANLLLVPLDRQRRWYRYHHLFAELLRHELDRLDPDAVRVLARRASDFHAENGNPEQAVRYAQLAEDIPQVTRLVARLALPWYAAGRASTLRRWLDWLAQRQPTDAALGVLGAWVSILAGRTVEAERWAEVAERGSVEGTLPDGSTSVEAWRWTLRAAMSRDLDTMRMSAERALDLLAPTSQWRPTAEISAAWALLLAAEEDEADRRFAAAAEDGPALGAMAATALALAARALIALRKSRWLDAEVLATHSSSVVTEAHLEGYPSSALTHVVGARVAMHRADATAARSDAGSAESLARSLTRAIPHLAVVVRLELTRVRLALGDLDEAERSLAEAHDILWAAPGLGTLSGEADHLALALKEARTSSAEIARLTPAELRLLPLLSTQLSFREIAAQLFVSPHTVKHQALSIYRRLGVTSRTAAVRQARVVGLLPD